MNIVLGEDMVVIFYLEKTHWLRISKIGGAASVKRSVFAVQQNKI